jgi:hypothetical protein
MSALPPKADIDRRLWNVRFVPIAAICSFDYLVGAGEQGYRHGNPERLDGLKIDDQLDFRDLLHRQVSGGLLERAVRLRCLSLARNNHRRIGKLRAQRNRLSSLAVTRMKKAATDQLSVAALRLFARRSRSAIDVNNST